MERTHGGRPAGLYVLLLFIALLAIGACGGGIALLADTSGGVIGMPLSLLAGTPFHDSLIPGLTLLIMPGLIPAFLVYPLVRRPVWRWAGALNIYNDRHGSWTYSLYSGVTLSLWITMQVMFVGYIHPLQTICGAWAVAIIVCALLPSVMDYYCEPAR
ncbi:MAG TPA: hypothetical protein VMF59_17390 [Bacteroidota bacterium]|nr:hypothetical protein [Bacteroidota bacterium]